MIPCCFRQIYKFADSLVFDALEAFCLYRFSLPCVLVLFYVKRLKKGIIYPNHQNGRSVYGIQKKGRGSRRKL